MSEDRSTAGSGAGGGGGGTEEKKPINNRDVDVSVCLSSRQQPCDDVTHTQRLLIALIVLATLLLLTVIIVLVGIFQTRCSLTNFPNNGTPSLDTDTGPVKPDYSHLRWSNIRLPRSVIPTSYSVTLRIDLDTFTFSGSVEIDVHTTSATDLIVLHVGSLVVDSNDLFLVRLAKSEGNDDDGGIRERFVSAAAARVNDLFLLETAVELKALGEYRIVFGNFTGVLTDDLRGLYRSSYRDQAGKTRSVASYDILWFNRVRFDLTFSDYYYSAILLLEEIQHRRLFSCTVKITVFLREKSGRFNCMGGMRNAARIFSGNFVSNVRETDI